MGPSRGTCTDVEVRKLKRGELAQWNDAARCRVGLRMEGVVMGCGEPQPRSGGAAERVGAGWFGANRVCWRAFRDAQVCWWSAGGRRRCHGVVTSGAKHGGTEGDTLRRLMQVGGREGRAGTGEHGLTLTGGQVVAGSNPVGPTKFMQVKCYVYLLPMLMARAALDSVSTTAGSPHPDPRLNAAATCAFCRDLTPAWPRRVLGEL